MKTEISAFLNLKSQPAEKHLERLGLNTSPDLVRTITFFDTRDMELFQKGLILRARLDKGSNQGEITVKLRGVDPARVPLQYFSQPGFKCEQDNILLGESRISCSARRKIPRPEYEEALRAQKFVSLLEPSQKQLASEFCGVNLEKSILVAAGPVEAGIWKTVFQNDRELKITLEWWKMRESKELMAASIRVPLAEEKEYTEVFQKALSSRKIQLAERPVSKTRMTLESYFRTTVETGKS